MTAEVAIMNPEAIVVAADSALTVGHTRVWNYGNKIFSLGHQHALGIMFFNSAEIREVPLETIIKDFRKKKGSGQFSSVQRLSEEFQIFLKGSLHFGRGDDLEDLIRITLNFVNDYAGLETEDDEVSITSESIGKIIEEFEDKIEVPDSILSLAEEAKDFFNSRIRSFVEDDDIFVDDDVDFIAFAISCLKKEIQSSDYTGIVFFGFGEDEYLPVLTVEMIDGAFKNWLRTYRTTVRDMNKPESSPAYLFTFAQSDMAKLFMDGVSPEIRYAFDAAVDANIKDKRRKTRIKEAVDRACRQTSAQPIIRSIRTLPKEEMAAVAESLVDLTALRRKMDSDVRTVGGPVDVACVSKGDGFIWLKRKHYFDPALNPDFMKRKGT